MSNFFDSDIVREELQEINELQMSIYKNAMKFGTFSREDKVDHIERLTELLERQKVMYTRISLSDDQIVDFLLANFVTTDNPKNLWIGEIINSGERTYADWTRRQQSISYLFKEECSKLLEEYKLDELFECGKGHPIILKRFLGSDISIETFVIFDIIFAFSDKFDEKLLDPVWETVSMKIRKYKPFLNINVFNFKKILREIVNE